MRIVLHIGLHKTGTTSLQHILKTRFSTLTPNGVWYPPTDPGGPGHAAAVHEFFGFSGGSPNPAALLQHVEKAEREGVDTLVLSSEDFVRAEPKDVPLLGKALEGREIDLFMTMSPLLRRAISQWQEMVKHGDPTALPDALPYLVKEARHATLILSEFIDQLRPKSTHVIIVDTKASPYKLIRDFWKAARLGSIAFTNGDNTGVQLNRSFNLVETELLRCINRYFPKQDVAAASTYLIHAVFLTPPWAQMCPKSPIDTPESWFPVFQQLAQETLATLRQLETDHGLKVIGDRNVLGRAPRAPSPLKAEISVDKITDKEYAKINIPSIIAAPTVFLDRPDWNEKMNNLEERSGLLNSTNENGSLVLHVGAVDLPSKPISLRTLFVQPAYPEHSPWLEYVPFAFWLMDAHRPRLFVQLGLGRGTSYFAFCQSVQRLGLNTRCYGVDSWTSADAADTAQKEAFRTVKSYNNSEYAHFSTILQSGVGKALDRFQDGSIGLLNIDIQENTSTISEDIENWITKLSDKAIVLVNGINTYLPNSELSRTINNLKATYKHFEFSYGDGLIAFAIGEEYSDHINFIFQSQGYDASISEIFYRIGRACYDSVKVSSLTEQLDALELERSRQHALIEALSADQGKHQSILEDRLRELGWFKHALEKSNLDRDQHQAELEKAQARIAELEAGRDHLSVEAEQAVSALKERVAQAEAEAKAARQELEQAQATAQEQQAELEKAQARIAELEAGRDHLSVEAEQAVSALKERVAQAEAETKAARQELEQAQATAQEQQARLKAERGQLADQLAERNRTVAALGDEAEAERKAHAAALDAAEARLAALDADLRETQKRAAEAEAERSHTQAEASHMGTMLQVRYREITDLVQALEAERNQHGAERSELKAQVNSLEAGLQATRQALSDAQGQSVAAAAKHADLKAECDRLAGLLEERDRAAAALVQQVAGEQAQTEAVREALQDAQARAAAAKAEGNALREENGRITGKLQSQQSELAALTQEIETARAKHAAELAALTELLEQNGVSENDRRSALLAMTLGIIKSMCAHATSIPDNTEAIRHISHTLAASGAFDPEWYRSTYEDVAASDMDPLLHFIAYGFNEGRLPSQSFA